MASIALIKGYPFVEIFAFTYYEERGYTTIRGLSTFYRDWIGDRKTSEKVRMFTELPKFVKNFKGH